MTKTNDNRLNTWHYLPKSDSYQSSGSMLIISSPFSILNMREKGRSAAQNVDIMYPYIILSLNLRGNSHSLYDMKDIRASKNDLTVFLPLLQACRRHLSPSI